MSHIETTIAGELACVTLHRGKVNALNPAVVDELQARLDALEGDDGVRGLVLTGYGSFFSFGFDVPELYAFSREEFARFLERFTTLQRRLYLFPKPVVAALNGHAVAGGCMLAIACDRRVMAAGKGKISLNEITFGASAFAAVVEILQSRVGRRNAETVLLGGEMFEPQQALELGLVDRVVPAEELQQAAREEAQALAGRSPAAFRSIKQLLRGPAMERAQPREADSIRDLHR